MRLCYLVHDLDDAAVRRRRHFLRDGGATVATVGFRRGRAAGPAGGPDQDGLQIGRTADGRLLRRVGSTLRAAFLSRSWRGALRGSDVIVARTLEMLLIAVLVRRRLGLGAPIVYECLDIHRLMTVPGLAGRCLRRLEQRLLDSSALLVVSSPRFVEAYFDRTHRRLPPWRLLENKLLVSELRPGSASRSSVPSPPGGPPWRIGWFGILRCARSLELLAALVRSSGGRIEVEMRGRPARGAVPQFDAVVAATPGLVFGGSYDRAADLAGMYGRVHFNWAIDFYEDGLNSSWLLPNRLYEGSMFGSVPLALGGVETGQWLARHGCGILLDDPPERTLGSFFAQLTQAGYRDARDRVLGLDRAVLAETPDTAAAFVAMLRRLAAGAPPAAAPSGQDHAA